MPDMVDLEQRLCTASDGLQAWYDMASSMNCLHYLMADIER
jgi:hypothetical protein